MVRLFNKGTPMRYAITLLLCLAVFSARAQDSFKQVIYTDPDSNSTITLTGPDTLALQTSDGVKRTGKYVVADKKMHVDWAAGGGKDAEHVDFDMPAEGLLLNPANEQGFGTEEVIKAVKAKQLAVKCLSNARQIALGCKLYASDNNGKFPDKLADLIPTYIQDEKLFVSPLSEKKEAMGYDYSGKGGTDSDAPKKVLLTSKDLTPDGKRIVVYFDGSGELKADK